jgi:hypothetical protein
LIRLYPNLSDLIRACALKRFGAQARSIAFDFACFIPAWPG